MATVLQSTRRCVARIGVIALLLAVAPLAGQAASVPGMAPPGAPVAASDPRVDLLLVTRMAAVCEDVEWQVGVIVGIVDGDTADIRIGKSRLERLCLAEIDAPERGAPWSKRSKQLLSDLIYGEEVMIAITDWDRYNRAVARIFLWSDDGAALVDVSQQMIQQGGAWYFERFGRDRSMLIAESTARRSRAGVWSLPDRERVPPREWRKMPKEERDLHC
jgi:endonuclease YncB( thermonuclease family)